MKSATLFVIIAVFGHCCPVMAESMCSVGEKRLYTVVEHAFQQGLMTTTTVEVGEARLNYLQARLACKEISKSDFCKDAIELATNNLSTELNELNSGVKSPIEVIHFQRELRELKTFCK